jgi:CubicO group peptidase (beta-lactamase class C family)
MGIDDVVAEATRGWNGSDGAGGVIALFEGPRVTRSWCLGLADLESRRAWTLDTPTRLASLSKHVTAAAIFKLGLEGTLGARLDGLQDPLASTTTDRALTMTSGIPDLGESLTLAGLSLSTHLTAERLHRLSCRIAHLNFPAGTEVSYSNTNFRLAQHVVERATGEAFAPWLRRNFFAPLGLHSFALAEDQSEVVPGLASGYWHLNGRPRRGVYGMHYSGSGGMVASTHDLVAWLDALLRGAGPTAGLFAKLAAPGRLVDGTPVGYAHGLMLHRLGDVDLVGHAGSLPGYKNHFLLEPHSGRGVAVFSNREETDAQALALAMLAAAFAIPHAPTPPERIATGLFVDPRSGDTLELADGARGPAAAFLGTEERLFVGADGAWCSDAPHLPIRIDAAAPDATELVARIGGGARRSFTRANATADPAIAGRYRCVELGATHEIALRGDGLAMRWGRGALPDEWCALRPGVADCYATSTPAMGPWRQRPALKFMRDPGGRIAGFTLSSNRSRGWRFERI